MSTRGHSLTLDTGSHSMKISNFSPEATGPFVTKYYIEPSWCVRMCVSILVTTVPRVAQLYGTIAAHTRRRTSVLVVFVVFCVHMYSFAKFCLIRQTPLPTFSDTAIITRPPL